MIQKVISGGQTGVDQLGLEVARELGIPTGGTAPAKFMTEKGPDPTLKDFGLVESISEGYPFRTLANVLDSDGTVLFGNMESRGSKETLKYLVANGKPHIENPTIEKLIEFIEGENISILNVAGNRGSRLSESNRKGFEIVLKEALTHILATKTCKRGKKILNSNTGKSRT